MSKKIGDLSEQELVDMIKKWKAQNFPDMQDKMSRSGEGERYR